VVRAEMYRIQRRTVFCQQSCEMIIETPQPRFIIIPERDAALICHHTDHVSFPAGTADGRRRPGDQLAVFGLVRIACIDINHAVPVKKNGSSFHVHSREISRKPLLCNRSVKI